MFSLRMNRDKTHYIPTVFLAILAIVLCAFFPGILSGSYFELTAPLSFSVPFFLIFVVIMSMVRIESKNNIIIYVIRALELLLFVFMIIYATELLAGGDIKTLLFDNIKAYLFEFLMLLIVIAAAYAMTGRLSWAIRIAMLIAAVFGYVSYFTLQFRGTPFIPSDFFAAKTALAVLPNYKFTFTLQLAESLLVFFAVFVGAGRMHLPEIKKILNTIIRILTLFVALLIPTMFISEDVFYKNNWNVHYWMQQVSITRNGSIVNFLANIPDLIPSKPDDYSTDKVNEIASRYFSDTAASADAKPDIILIMGESWANLTRDNLSETNKEVMPFMSSLAGRDNSLYHTLRVSSYGGGTSYSEFQVLTGSSGVYGLHSAPFQFNMSDSTPNIVRSLKQLGYDTTAMHTGTLSAWGRDKAFPLLGFDQFLDANAIESAEIPRVRSYVSDEALYVKILNTLEQSDTPQFIYGITIQTHGGYEYEQYDSAIQIKSPQGEYPKAEQYLGLMNDSDAAFKAFIKELEARDRPTIVLAYGDHLPLVDEDYMADLQAAWGAEHEDADNPAIWGYETFYVMWSNFSLPEDTENQSESVSLNYLGAYLLYNAGLPLTGYQKFLLDSANRFPVSSTIGFMDSDGNYLTIEEAADTETFRQQSLLQYNMLHDLKHYPDDFYYLK